MEQKMKHLELIQEVIKRMANNSFLLKGWTVTLVTGILALASKDTDKQYFWIAYIPILMFWFLDAYYLQLERRYRRLYNSRLEEREVNFSMQMPIPSIEEKTTYIQALVSKTEIGFYIALGIIISIVFLMM